jgi:predicted GIY-YIG superfamily endonuclease
MTNPDQMFHYVCLLKSQSDPSRHDTGLTEDLDSPLAKHNRGEVPSTTPFRPWCIDVAIAFRERNKAVAFENYLKSHSGRAFAKKHL